METATGQTGFFSTLLPRVRITGAVLLSLETALLADWRLAAMFLALALLFFVFSNSALHDLRRLLLPLNFFLAFLWLTLPFDLFGAHAPGLSPEGLGLCVLITIKANAAAVFLLALLGGLSLPQMAETLHSFHLPDKFCTLFILLCRHIQILQQSLHFSLLSLRLRPQPARLPSRLRAYAYVLGSSLVHAADRAEMVRLALLCRKGNALRLPGPAPCSTRRDYCFLIACILPLPVFWGMLHAL